MKDEKKIKVQENWTTEIEFIKHTILEKSEKGENEMECIFLELTTIQWLKENGYRYKEFRRGGRIYWG